MKALHFNKLDFLSLTKKEKPSHNSVFGTAYWKKRSCPCAGIIQYTLAVKTYM